MLSTHKAGRQRPGPVSADCQLTYIYANRRNFTDLKYVKTTRATCSILLALVIHLLISGWLQYCLQEEHAHGQAVQPWRPMRGTQGS